MEQQEDFYITLLSNSSFDQNPDNTTSCFKVALSREINLGEGDYAVALADFIVPNTIYNVSEKNNKIFVTHYSGVIDKDKHFIVKREHEISIPCGYYETIKDLTAAINKGFSNSFGTKLFEEGTKLFEEFMDEFKNTKLLYDGDLICEAFEDQPPKIKFRETKTFVPEKYVEQWTSARRFEIKLQNRLSVQMGFTPDSNLSSLEFSPNRYDLAFGVPSEIFFYLDILEPQLIGDSSVKVAKIVKTLQPNLNYGDTIFHEIQNRCYLKLGQKSFSSVEVELRDSVSNLIQFSHGVSIINLHFKRINN